MCFTGKIEPTAFWERIELLIDLFLVEGSLYIELSCYYNLFTNYMKKKKKLGHSIMNY